MAGSNAASSFSSEGTHRSMCCLASPGSTKCTTPRGAVNPSSTASMPVVNDCSNFRTYMASDGMAVKETSCGPELDNGRARATDPTTSWRKVTCAEPSALPELCSLGCCPFRTDKTHIPLLGFYAQKRRHHKELWIQGLWWPTVSSQHPATAEKVMKV